MTGEKPADLCVAETVVVPLRLFYAVSEVSFKLLLLMKPSRECALGLGKSDRLIFKLRPPSSQQQLTAADQVNRSVSLEEQRVNRVVLWVLMNFHICR